MSYRRGKKFGFNSKNNIPKSFKQDSNMVWFFFFFLVNHLDLLLGDRIQELGGERNRIPIRRPLYSRGNDDLDQGVAVEMGRRGGIQDVVGT